MPYDDTNVRKMLRDQLNKRLRYPPQVAFKISTQFKELISKLIEPDTEIRYNVHQVIAHPWLNRTIHDMVSRSVDLSTHHAEMSSSIASSSNGGRLSLSNVDPKLQHFNRFLQRKALRVIGKEMELKTQ